MKLKDILKNNPFTFVAICFAVVISGITLVFSKPAGIIELVGTVIIAVLSVRWFARTIQRKKEYLKLLHKSLEDEGDEENRLMTFPLPAVMIRENGDITWFNSHFEPVFKAFDGASGVNIGEMIEFPAQFIKNGDMSPFETAGVSKKYTVYPSRLSENLWILYFTDDTVLKDIRTQFNITRPAVLLINIDSLEQTEDMLSHADYYSVVSDVDRLISQWLVGHDCVFRKFTDGRFFAVTERKNLDRMTSENFGILDAVRGYRFGETEVDITLSVGIGREDSFAACEVSARQALDMARGRGGDQVALKVGDSYEFFGGITGRKEKRGKVKSRTVAAALNDYVENCSAVYIMGHAFSDFDCIGAAVGIAAVARANGKNAFVVVNRKNTLALPLIRHLEEAGGVTFIDPEKAVEQAHEGALLVVTDTMRPQLTEAPKLLEKKLHTVVIDHHRMSVDHIENASLLFHEPYASSACEMVTELVQYSPAKPKLTQAEAEALLSGILLDTKNFSLRVGVRTFEAAAFLRDRKTDTVTVRKLFSATAEENVLISRLISSAVFHENYAVAEADFDSPDLRVICSKAADALLDIENIDASFVVSSYGGGVNISARSLGKINVQLIMEALGGGGHQSMAACQLKDVTREEAVETLNGEIERYFEKVSQK